MKRLFSNIAFLAASLLIFHAKAFPKGAGGCEAGAAVETEGSPHWKVGEGKSFRKGTFEDSGIVVSIASVPLSTSIGNIFPTGRDLDINVQATQEPFKGIWIRLERSDGKNSYGCLSPVKNTQDADFCQSPAVGITHKDDTVKSEASGSLRFDEEASSVSLDITIVYANEDQQTDYVHNKFELVFQQFSDTKSPPIKEEPIPIISNDRRLFQTNATTPSTPTVVSGQETQWKPPTPSPVKEGRVDSPPTYQPTTASTLIEISRPPVNKNARVMAPTVLPSFSSSFFGSTTEPVNGPPSPSVVSDQTNQRKAPTPSPVTKGRVESAPTYLPTTASTLIEITRPPVNKNARVMAPTVLPSVSSSFFGSTTEPVNGPPSPAVVSDQANQMKPPTPSPVKKGRVDSAPTFTPTITSTTAFPTSSSTFFGSTTMSANNVQVDQTTPSPTSSSSYFGSASPQPANNIRVDQLTPVPTSDSTLFGTSTALPSSLILADGIAIPPVSIPIINAQLTNMFPQSGGGVVGNFLSQFFVGGVQEDFFFNPKKDKKKTSNVSKASKASKSKGSKGGKGGNGSKGSKASERRHLRRVEPLSD
jgi:hypothetical protein